jgi:hypothetical protein
LEQKLENHGLSGLGRKIVEPMAQACGRDHHLHSTHTAIAHCS